MKRQKKTAALMFLDVKGYSKLQSDHEFDAFFSGTLDAMAAKVKPHQPIYVNSWGDAIFAAFSSMGAAARAALDLRDYFRNENWKSHGFKEPLAARIGLHCGTVFVGPDPLQERDGLAGHNVNLAARIEPVALPNEAWMSEAAWAILKEENDDTIAWDDLGERPLAKQWGSRRLFRLRRATEQPNTEISDLEKVDAPNPDKRKVELATRLLKYASTEDDRRAAIKMLITLPGHEQIEDVLKVARDKHESRELRKHAIGSLIHKKGPAVAKALQVIADDEQDSLDVRSIAIEALGDVGGPESLDTLRKAFQNGDWPGIMRGYWGHTNCQDVSAQDGCSLSARGIGKRLWLSV